LETADPFRLKGRKDISSEGQALAKQYWDFSRALQEAYDPDRGFGDDLNIVQDLAYVQPRVYVWKRKTTN